MSEMKRGRLSNKDKEFIGINVEEMTVEEISNHIKKTPSMIRKYIRDTLKIEKSFSSKADGARYDLRKKEIWPFLKEQFTQKELDLLVSDWGRIIAQFNCDVLPTEEDQIIESIKLGIFANRCHKKQKDSMGNIEDLNIRNVQIKAIMRNGKTPDGKKLSPEKAEELRQEMMENFETLSFLETSTNKLSSEYKDYLINRTKILTSLKATRDQRVARIETSKETIINWISKLVEDPEYRERCGYEMERMHQSFLLQKEKLGNYHTYDDGKVDQPFLNHETVMRENEQNGE